MTEKNVYLVGDISNSHAPAYLVSGRNFLASKFSASLVFHTGLSVGIKSLTGPTLTLAEVPLFVTENGGWTDNVNI